MRTFGGFISNGALLYGELRNDAVHVLAQPYWLGLEFSGEVIPLADLQVDLPVAPGKIIAVGLNYADHIKEMQRTPLGTPLIWFKAPSSLLPHGGTIRRAAEDKSAARRPGVVEARNGLTAIHQEGAALQRR